MNQNIIVLVKGKEIECWGSLKRMCLAKGYPYHTLARLKFPIEYEGVTIHKVMFN